MELQKQIILLRIEIRALENYLKYSSPEEEEFFIKEILSKKYKEFLKLTINEPTKIIKSKV